MYNIIRKLRNIKGITQKNLARDLGITRQALSNIELNKNNCSIVLAFRISNYFKLEIEDIFLYYKSLEEELKVLEDRYIKDPKFAMIDLYRKIKIKNLLRESYYIKKRGELK